MSNLGTKLQGVHKKVNTRLGTQDAKLVFRRKTLTDGTEFGLPYADVDNSDVTIQEGAIIQRVKSHEADAYGTLRVGDLKLKIPAGLITEAQLTDAQIIYSGATYSIISRQPTEIFGGVPVNWVIIARQES